MSFSGASLAVQSDKPIAARWASHVQAPIRSPGYSTSNPALY